MLDRIGGGEVVLPRGSETPAGQPGQDGRPANPADGLTDEGIGEARAALGQTVDIGGLGKRMPIATERARGLVVSKEEDDIRLLGRRSEASGQEAEREDEFFHLES